MPSRGLKERYSTATRADFSAEHWHRVSVAPIGAAAVISAADDVDKSQTSEEQELQTFDADLEVLAKIHDKSDLVQDVIHTLVNRAAGDDRDLADVFRFALHQTEGLNERLEDVADAVRLLEDLGDAKEAKAYRKFILEAAETVAGAAKESVPLLAGKTSKKESTYLRKLRKMVG